MTDEAAKLTETLVRIAYDLGLDNKAVTDPVAVLAALDRVREIANNERGAHRALAEVAEAFLRVLARGHAGRDALAVHAFLKSHPDDGINLLRQTLTTHGLPAEKLDDPERTALVWADVVRQRGEHAEAALFVTPRSRSLVRDACEPLAFRLWHSVEEARRAADKTGWSTIVDVRRKAAKREVDAFVGRLGCTEMQAREHLERFPLRER